MRGGNKEGGELGADANGRAMFQASIGGEEGEWGKQNDAEDGSRVTWWRSPFLTPASKLRK